MQILVNISEKDYESIKKHDPIPTVADGVNAYNAVLNGRPLPKGRMIILSEDAVKREQVPLSFSCQKWISEVGLSNATVAIIEADKVESELQESDIEKRKPCINYEDGCEEWAGCPCVNYKARKRG